MRSGGTLAALVLMASCDAGTTQNGTSGLLRDASAAETEGVRSSPEAAAGAEDPSVDAPVTWVPLSEAWPDSAGDARGVGLDATYLGAPGPEPPYTGCGADAAEAGFCPVPHSLCADSPWLVFYDNAQCVSGSCTWDKRYVSCGTIGCFLGQCQIPFTM
jgi:hypothetical protein